jgi:predicted nucleotidyltransferase
MGEEILALPFLAGKRPDLGGCGGWGGGAPPPPPPHNPPNPGLIPLKAEDPKYFYVLRPVLAVMWLERGLGVVPTEFTRLVEGVLESGPLLAAIEVLLADKQAGKELDFGPRIPAISDFLKRELARMEVGEFERRVGNCPVERLNELFRLALDEVWGR